MTDLLPEGLHFGLHEDLHRADPGLGSTDMKALLTSPVNGYWKRTPNGQRIMQALGIAQPEAESPSLAQIFGTAAHALLLEPERFDDLYVEDEDAPADYLTSKDVIREALMSRAAAYLPPKTAPREEWVMAAKRASLKVIEDWKVDFIIHAAGRTVLSKRWMAQLRMIDRIVRAKRADLGGKSIFDQNLTGGYAEVTVIWDEDGVRMKARFDYMRTMGVIDVKTYQCPDDKPPISHFLGHIANYAYDLQAAHYMRAWEELGKAIADGRVFGAVDPAWLKRVKVDDKPAWRWLAISSMGLPEVDFVDFDAPTALSAANVQRQQAIETFRRYSEQFGHDEPWVSMRGRIVADDDTLNATGVARRMIGRGETTWTEA